MRKRISLQLIAGFAGVITVAVLVIGFIFIGLYQRAAMDTKQEDMLYRARNISLLMSDYLVEGTMMRGMGGFFRFMDVVNDAQLWVLDADGNVISMPGQGTGMHETTGMQGTEPLPGDAKETVSILLSGQEIVNEDFSSLLGEATLSVGIPIYSEFQTGSSASSILEGAPDADVVGAVLLHASVRGVNQGLTRAYGILALGLVLGLLAALALGTAYSLFFTKPLTDMNRTAHAMADGNYTVRTALKRADEFGQLGDALDHLAVSLETAAQESDKLEQMRKDFVANVSHEFRTPLTVIRGSTEALLDGTAEGPEETERRLQAILAETAGMNRLVGDLLELSRLESGRVQLSPEPVFIGELLDDVWRSVSLIASKAQIILERRILDNIPPVFADYGRLRQLFLIFLDNALKHAPEGSHIAVSAEVQDTRMQITICDTGAGIPAEDLKHIWERFYTVDKARNRQGTGLGLPIARQLAELLHGTVTLNCPSEGGTCAVIMLPIAEMPVST